MSEIVVISIGMVTPLGLSPEQTAASVAAGLSSFEETTMLDKGLQPFVMGALPTDSLPQLNDMYISPASILVISFLPTLPQCAKLPNPSLRYSPQSIVPD